MHGVGSLKGWPKCSVGEYCDPKGRRTVFNGVHAYPYASTSPPKVPVKLRQTNNQKRMFAQLKPLLLANTFCGPGKHAETGCFFEFQRLPWELIYTIAKYLLTQDKSKRGNFEIVRKIPQRNRPVKKSE
jgi:hypothetical protein